jgi:hypothetical protein
MRNSRGWSLLVALTLMVWLGCDRVTTSPVDAPDRRNSSLSDLSDAEEEALKDLLESEERRIDEAEEASEATYDSLKAIWQKARDDGSSLITCEPLPYDADTRIIGPEGGTLNIGPHRLKIPPGALTKPTVITGELPVSVNVSVKLSPSGLRFSAASQLKLSYKHCSDRSEYIHSVVFVNDEGEITEWPISFDYSSYEEVFGAIWHFSKYAVASN